ncbi:fidgetin-like protein 1 isoform 6 [Mus musculus]|uniref:fidgetin-like protein 1 isoform 6 n=1 Tax=Mus musculus TaxID=10090 RepID=UPI0029C9DBAB|nr:fidgetin-like protein 1 isoform 6 [Mus musculus]
MHTVHYYCIFSMHMPTPRSLRSLLPTCSKATPETEDALLLQPRRVMKPSDSSPKLRFAPLGFEPRSVNIPSFSVILTHELVSVTGQCGEQPALRISDCILS